MLIRELIRSGREPTPDDLAWITGRLATAPFEPRSMRVRVEDRGLTYRGHTLGASEPSLSYHLVKRVLIERQWTNGTTASQYLADLRRAVRATSARLVLFERRGGPLAAVVVPTDQAVPEARQGERSLPHTLVIYSADRGIIVTGYQISALEMAGIPEGARWLK